MSYTIICYLGGELRYRAKETVSCKKIGLCCNINNKEIVSCFLETFILITDIMAVI